MTELSQTGSSRRSFFWPCAVAAVFIFSLVGLLIAQHLCAQHILFEAAPTDERTDVYNATSGAAGALLGFVIAALTALLAVRGSRLNEGRAWLEIPGLLLAAAVFVALSLFLSIAGLSLDASREVSSGFVAAWSASVIAATVALILGLVAFGMAVLTVADDRGSATPE